MSFPELFSYELLSASSAAIAQNWTVFTRDLLKCMKCNFLLMLREVLKSCFEFTGVVVELQGDYENLGHNSLQKSLLILKSKVGLPGHLIYKRVHSMCRMKVILEKASLESRRSSVL